MAKELENFLKKLEPRWEDAHEFDWIKVKKAYTFQKKNTTDT